MNEITKRLNKLVKQRKIHVVVTEQGSVKRSSRSSGFSSDDYYSGNLNYEWCRFIILNFNFFFYFQFDKLI